MNDLPSTRLEIDLQALKHNFNYFKDLLQTETVVIAAVKANAYGTDAVTVAKHLEKLGVDYLAVVFTREGIALREAGIKKPILVFQATPEEIPQVVEYNLEPSLYSDSMFRAFCVYAEEEDLDAYPVHIKFNTGMNRLGMALSQAESLGVSFETMTNLQLKSIFTHFASSDDPNERIFTQQQIRKFNKASKEIESTLGYMPMRHACNTMGVLNYRDAHFDAVRVGIGLYGYTYDDEINKELKPVGKLFAPIVEKHYLNPGDSVGYGRTFIAEDSMIIAVIPLGHADGISRAYGQGKGWVCISNRKAPIIGNVCMDMLMVDVTDISCDEGELVEIFGDNNAAIELANSIDTVVYELITAVSSRVSRVVTGINIILK